MKFPAFVLLALSAAFFGVCQAQQASQPPVGNAPPTTTAPASPPPPAPAHHSRSLQKAPAFEAPAPAGASKPDSGNPDVVIGGLPGAKSTTAVERQP
jgi:hypothetical protein